MKVVIFCGGLGVRMGEATQRVPKPMITVGLQPMLWHIMKWYSSWGHSDFVLCLGHHGEMIKQYFLDYNEALANDFVLSNGGRDIELLGADISDWHITFVDTGAESTIAERLKAVESYVDDPIFLATYGDGLTDAPLDEMIARLDTSGKTGLFISVPLGLEYHMIQTDREGVVERIESIAKADVRINGGYFVFRQGIFDAIQPGEELVEEPFARLIERRELLAYPYDGFWKSMDTIKDKQELDGLLASGRSPWLRPPSVAP